MNYTLTYSTFDDSERRPVIRLTLFGKLKSNGYENFVPHLEEIIEAHGRIALLVDLRFFEGWTTGGSWSDLLFGLKLYSCIERLAIVGDRKWNLFIADLCSAFEGSVVGTFEGLDLKEAETWLSDEEDPGEKIPQIHEPVSTQVWRDYAQDFSKRPRAWV